MVVSGARFKLQHKGIHINFVMLLFYNLRS